MKATRKTVCSDCGGNLKPIRILQRGIGRIGTLDHRELDYTKPEAKRGFMAMAYPTEGKVSSEMCEACGRIFLFAEKSTSQA